MSETSGRLGSPFVSAESFETEAVAAANGRGPASPFLEAFTAEGSRDDESAPDPRLAARRVFLANVYDDELDEALYEVIDEAAAFAGNGRMTRLDSAALDHYLAPMAEEMESAIQRLADQFGDRDPASVSESELDDALSRIQPGRQLSPAFEQLFGGLKNLVKKVASGAATLAKKGIEAAASLGLGPLLAQLKKLVRPLLERVLKAAIDRLPASLQPAARQLAGRLPQMFQSESDGTEDGEEPAVDVSAIQHELDGHVADMIFNEPRIGADNELEEWGDPAPAAEGGIADLDAARDRFISEMESLDDGEDPGPAVEQFIPAILPALKLGIRLAGRKRVVSVLSSLISKLITRFVGPASSGALSTALADSGLKLMSLEMTDADQRRTAQASLAATLEDTVRSVAALPDSVLDNETLLEGSILRAFEDAATANLPPLLSEMVYRRRPDLVETDNRRGAWIPCPIRGPKRYKKFSRVVRARITPRMAMAIPIFGDVPLAVFMQEQLGLEPGEELEADVHLYEAMPGMLLGEVARSEANGNGASASSSEFHPLSTEAASLLVGEPGLGRPAAPANRAAPQRMAVGQRFFRLSVPGRRVAAVTTVGARRHARRRTSVRAVLDFPGDKIRLHLFLSERRAQELAAALRKQAHAGAIAATLRGLIDTGVAAAVSGNVTGRIRIIHEALAPQQSRGPGLKRLPAATLQPFASRIGQWTLGALSDFLAKQAPRFITATEDSQDGVTIIVTLTNPPGMAALRSGLSGGAPSKPPAAPRDVPSLVEVDVKPGFKNA